MSCSNTPPAALISLMASAAAASIGGYAMERSPVSGSRPPIFSGSRSLESDPPAGGFFVVVADSSPAPTYSVLASSSLSVASKCSVA
jgi:hypothetical protein